MIAKDEACPSPDWYPRADMDGGRAASSRHQLLDMVWLR